MDKLMTILIVEDSGINRKILRGILENDYEILEAENGEQALECLRSGQHVDFIILDLMMPVMNGLEFLHVVKQDARFDNIPIIVNSNANDQESEYKALELGADDFIAKPYNPKVAQRRIANLIDKYVFQKQVMQKEISRTQEQLSTLIDTVPGGIAVMHITGRIELTYYNDVLCDILGYSREDMAEQIAHDPLKIVVQEDRRQIIDAVTVAEERVKGELVDVTHNWKVRVVRKNGELRWVQIIAKPMETEPEFVHAVFMDVTDEMVVEKQLQDSMVELCYRAEHDRLTGVYNREAFYKATEKLITENASDVYVLGVWNVDRFKVINELFGSKTGDKILKGIANTLQKLTAVVGTCGRLEADSFAICLPEEYLKVHMPELLVMLTGNENWGLNNYPVMSHIGFYRIENNDTAINLMCDRAGMALMQIKGNYLERWCYYSESLKETIINEQELINDMEIALREHQFVVYYQPMMDAKKQNVIRAEALVRWKHPIKGMISPGLFIPLFERNGFISLLDMYVCEEVCRFQSQLKQKGIPLIPISINLSRMNFYNPKLCREILDLVNKYGISPEDLEIEITESAYKENSKDLIRAIQLFQKHGFKVLMDDFGSGYSSLNMLKDLSVDVLKIDMKFIDDLENSERATNIMFSIIRMAQALEMDTIAEGVETKSQYEMLSCMGCGCIQGYYFSKPLPADEFVDDLIKNYNKENVEVGPEAKQTILLVDDVEMNLEILSDILGDKYNILCATSGHLAEEILKKEFAVINLVISDIHMPDGDGFELLKSIQDSPLTKDIPMLMVTAYDDAKNLEKSLELGALDVIFKPYDSDILRRRIENILKISEGQNMELEVRALRESTLVKKQMENMLTEHVAGMCRMKLGKTDVLEISEVIFANKQFETWHPEINLVQKDLTFDSLIMHMKEEYKFSFRRAFETAINQQDPSCQCRYKMTDLQGQIYEHVISCTMSYVGQEIIVDCVEIAI